MAAVLVPLITIGQLGSSDNPQTNQQELLTKLKAARDEVNNLKVKLRSALNGTTEQLINVTRRKREEPSQPGPSSPVPPPPPPSASAALPDQAASQTPSTSPASMASTNASSTISKSVTSPNVSLNLSNPVVQTVPTLTTSNFSSLNNSTTTISSPSSIQSLSRNVHEILDQLSAAGGQAVSHSGVGNITELILRLQINGNYLDNNTMEATEESINLMRGLLNSLDETERKLDSAIVKLEEDRAREDNSTSTPERTEATNGTLIRLEEVLENLMRKAADSSNSSTSGLKC